VEDIASHRDFDSGIPLADCLNDRFANAAEVNIPGLGPALLAVPPKEALVKRARSTKQQQDL
jgi:hypothetical protein